MFLAPNQFEWKGFYELQFTNCFTLNLSREMYPHNIHSGKMVFRQSSSIDIVNKKSISKFALDQSGESNVYVERFKIVLDKYIAETGKPLFINTALQFEPV